MEFKRNQAFIIQTEDDLNKVDSLLRSSGLNYRAYENDIDFFRPELMSDVNFVRFSKLQSLSESIIESNKSDTRLVITGANIVEIPYLNHIEYIEHSTTKWVFNDKFQAILINITNSAQFDFKPIEIYSQIKELKLKYDILNIYDFIKK